MSAAIRQECALAGLEPLLVGLGSERAALAEQRSRLRAAFALSFDGLVVGVAQPRLARAQRELARLHAQELAELFRRAARMRISDRVEALGAWRIALSEALDACVADGMCAGTRLRELLTVCCVREPREWPGAVELAEAALALDPNCASRVLLARALGHALRWDEAIAVLANALSSRVAPSARAELVRRLVALLERDGRSREALELSQCA
ncbi:MAG: hypothetical protein IT454_10950 [Planctomycetes bacterium]|nr:hypothetical protein [Planctomycetota bacterium]